MANLDDKTIKGITITAICLYAAVLIAGFAMHRQLLYVSIINALASLLIIGYWVWDKLRPLTRLTETRELIILLIEILLAAMALYSVITTSSPNWLAIIQYIIFGIHALLLVLFLIFMLTFKIKKLF